MSHGISGRHLGSPFSFQQGFDYDSINRLRIFQDNGLSVCGSAAARQQYVFDRFGNRAVLNGSCGNGDGAFVPWVSADSETEVEGKFPNNRWQVNSGDTTGTGRHDGSGNVNAASGNLYEYDAENRMVKATAGGIEYRYRYDGEGRRVAVEKWTAGVQDTAYTRRFVYGLDGELLAEIQGTVLSSWETKYLGQDHLGTTRLVMKASGSGDGVVGSRHDYYPFGEELPGRGMNYGDPLLLVKYTGHERDNETGLDFMQARYYGGGIGRFLSPDGPLVDQEVGDPQSWNLYSYVRNSPMILIDPTGMYDEDPDAPKRVTKPGTSVTVSAKIENPPTFEEKMEWLELWKSGKLPREIPYGPKDGETKDLRVTGAMARKRKEYKEKGCPASFDISVGSWEAGIELADNVLTGSLHSKTFNATQMQVGGMVGRISRRGNVLSVKVENTAGLGSYRGLTLLGRAFGFDGNQFDNPNGPDGPFHNVVQTFQWDEPNPCQK
jgi:RHS repeat-associated protein